MGDRAHRVMLIHFSNALSRDDAVKIAKAYNLSPSSVDKINTTRGSPGLDLLSALEQRLIISEDEEILNSFCQTLYDLHLDDSAALIKKTYPHLSARQKNPPRRVLSASRFSAETTECGGPVMPPASLMHIKQENDHHQSGNYNGSRSHPPLSDLGHHQNTDVSDKTLSELSECIGGEWKQIAVESLKLKKYHVDQITEDHPRARNRVYEMFVVWRKRNAGRATPQALLELLKVRDDVDVDAISILEEAANGRAT